MLLINILLAFFGLGGTLAAFGGETWNKDGANLSEKVTLRGWVSLFCLLSAFGIGIYKELLTSRNDELSAEANRKVLIENKEREDNLKNELVGLRSKLEILNDSLVKQAKLVKSASDTLIVSVNKFGTNKIAELEDAFRLSANIPREIDDCVVNIDGEEVIYLPSRMYYNMELFWGDEFQFTFLDDGYNDSISKLASLKLYVAGRKYDMHPGTGNIFHHDEIRVYGSTPEPMKAKIINPLQLTKLKIKIFVRSTDATRGQQEFRRLVLSSQFIDYAKKIYKKVNQNIPLKYSPDKTASTRSSIAKNSFVRVLQIADNWAEIITPEGRQGWISLNNLKEIS
jgi:hypothetical protein